MISITHPRTASALAIMGLAMLVVIFQIGNPQVELQTLLILIISTLIGLAAFNFASNELKETSGVMRTFELGFSRIFAMFLFSIFIIIGYDIFSLSIIDMLSSVDLHDYIIQIIVFMIAGSIFYLSVFPFFQVLNLARAGEQSSLPSEFVIEAAAEYIKEKVRSPFVAAIILYMFFYGIPIFFIAEIVLDGDLLLSLLLWSLLLPLISVSALAGAGLGEDLIRLKMLRRPIRDLPKLGMPKISISPLKFKTGGFLLVLLAIQALVTTFYFGINSIGVAFSISEVGANTGIGISTILLILLNKGRGATKEIKQVWTETGFKVSIFQLFLPVFVFLGVTISSILEVLINNNPPNIADIVSQLGVQAEHIRIISVFLAVQNFFLIFTAIVIFKITPGVAERRLIKEIPSFYRNDDGSPDIDGYLYIYNKLKSDRSIENFLIELSKNIDKSIGDVSLIKEILRESFESGSEKVQVAASSVLYSILHQFEKDDEELQKLAKMSLNSPHSGARIFAIRSYRLLVSAARDEEKEDLIKSIVKRLNDTDKVVAWDSGLLLQHIINENPEYRSFILALVIKTLLDAERQSTVNSITRLLRKISYESDIIGRMAISTLGTYLQTEANADNLIQGVKALLRGNQNLAIDLIDIVSMGTKNPDPNHRKLSYMVLLNMAEYSEGLDEEIIELLLGGINDVSPEIQELAYSALRNEVLNSDESVERIYALIASIFDELQGIQLAGALDVIEAITHRGVISEKQIYDLIKKLGTSNQDRIRAKTLNVFSSLVANDPSLGDFIFQVCEESLEHPNEEVRQQAIITLGRSVLYYPELANVVYRKIKHARNDHSFKVQLAAIETMGYIAGAKSSLSDEIFNNLTPLLEDGNWQVRLASFNGLVAAAKKRRDLQGELTNQTLQALMDDDVQVREAGFDALVWLIPTYRESAEAFIQIAAKTVKNAPDDILTSLYDALEFIADKRIQYIDRIIPLLSYGFKSSFSSCRHNALNALTTCVSKLAKAREASRDIHKKLDRFVTALLEAANSSNAGIRSSAYAGIIEICVAVPHFRIASRGRKVLRSAHNTEKDVAVLDQLEKGIIRAKPPLDIDI